MRKNGILGSHRLAFRQGLHDGVPIGLGYFAVSFSLGIAAKNAGLSVLEATVASFLCNASAGEYAGFTLIAAGASYIEMAVMTLVVNARYMLMSCAMSQRIRPGERLVHRLGMGFYITDEIFAISVARPGFLDPFYTYGAAFVASPSWAIGTGLGVAAGALLPARLVSALSVALYGMFLAVIIPTARRDKVIAGLIVLSFAASYAAAYLPAFANISEGTRTIVLTVAISALAALVFPRSEEGEA